MPQWNISILLSILWYGEQGIFLSWKELTLTYQSGVSAKFINSLIFSGILNFFREDIKKPVCSMCWFYRELVPVGWEFKFRILLVVAVATISNFDIFAAVRHDLLKYAGIAFFSSQDKAVILQRAMLSISAVCVTCHLSITSDLKYQVLLNDNLKQSLKVIG